jgi:endonuclease/exonuclease/phosphatase family metal-dependent hydrolase
MQQLLAALDGVVHGLSGVAQHKPSNGAENGNGHCSGLGLQGASHTQAQHQHQHQQQFPVILTGDFNATPDSLPCKVSRACLHAQDRRRCLHP